jgi:integrase
MAGTAKGVRGANGDGGVRQRPSGRWEARAAVVDAAGRLHRRSVTADTERDARRRLRELVAQHEAGIIAPDARETMARFLTSWLEGVKPTLRPRSWDRYEEHVRLHLIPTLGRIPLARLSPMDVQRANNELLKMGLAPATVGRAHAALRAALKQALRWQLIPSNPASLVTPPRVEHREMAALDPDQARRFLNAARDTPLEALWVLAVTTGLRQGELLALQWSEVDLEGASLRVIGTLTRIHVEVASAGHPKTHRVTAPPKSARSRRRVEVGALAVDALREHRRRLVEQRLHAGTLLGRSRSGVLWSNRRSPASRPAQSRTAVASHNRGAPNDSVPRSSPHSRELAARSRREPEEGVGDAGPFHGSDHPRYL